MSKIDLEKLICSIAELSHEGYGTKTLELSTVKKALKEQGLEIKDGEIQEIKEEKTVFYKPWPRDCYEYVKDNTYHVPNRGPYVYEDTAYEAIDLAKREVAQGIIDLYNEGKAKTVDEILHHCYGIVDF